MSSYRKKKNRCRVDENHSRNAQSVSTTNQSATKQYLVRQLREDVKVNTFTNRKIKELEMFTTSF
jgi:hypothetical protein